MIKPINSMILVKPSIPQGVSSGGIFFVQKETTNKTEGTVLAVGEGRLLNSGAREPMEIKEGDIVIFEGFELEINENNEKLLLVDQKFIHAVIEE